MTSDIAIGSRGYRNRVLGTEYGCQRVTVDVYKRQALAGARMAGQERHLAVVDDEGHARQRLATVGVALVHLVKTNHVLASKRSATGQPSAP